MKNSFLFFSCGEEGQKRRRFVPCCTWLRQIGECATRLAYGSEWCRSYFVEGFFFVSFRRRASHSGQ